ncbi:MAG: glycosyltransferase [Actinomycetota bacterium]|nr:glycosyltransferase [Actinomycetota bacterium]
MTAGATAQPLRVDVVVVAYRSHDVIGPCIASLLQDPAVGQVIVVNNNPGDAVSRLVQAMPGVELIEADRNVGFGPGINLTRNRVGAPFVAIANPDTVQMGDTLTDIAAFLESRTTAGVASPRVFDSHGGLCCSSEREVSVACLLLDSLGLPPGLGTRRSRRVHRQAHMTMNLNGAFLVARRRALDDVGWFDDSIFLFGEDQDLCRRMRRAGWEVWYAPVGHVVHAGGHSWRPLGQEAWQAQRDARAEQLRRAHGPGHATMFRWLAAAKDVVRRGS